ncbi:MAG TPA: hypothetical protein VGF13_16725 [Verrucomicrobiae bacterium]|jgi:branched-subunit amino acid ABC-type transport system permease component
MQPEKTASSSTLLRIAGVGASLAFGAMVASLFALKSKPDGFAFELNAIAILAFVAAAALGWFYWRMIARMATDRAPQPRKKKFVVFSIGLVLIGIVSFLYPLKFIQKEKRKDVFIGLALAAGCIAGVGFVMMKVKKFLDTDLKKSEEDDRQ